MALTRVRRTGLNDGLVSDAKLDSGVGTQAVTTSTIRNGAVTTLKIADNSITTAKLSSSGGLEAIDTTVLRDGAVTPPKVDTTATFHSMLFLLQLPFPLLVRSLETMLLELTSLVQTLLLLVVPVQVLHLVVSSD